MQRLTKSEIRILYKVANKQHLSIMWSDWLAGRKLRANHLISLDENGVLSLTPKARFLMEVGFL